MKIQAPKYSQSSALRRPEARRDDRSERVVDRVELRAGGVQKGSRWVGRVGKFISKVPKFLAHTAKFIGVTLLGGLTAAVQLAAGSIGLVGMAGLGLAGALEVRDGIKEKDPLKMLSGTGEIVRGAYTGALSTGYLLDLGQHAGMAVATSALGALQGSIYLTSGAMKFVKGRAEGDNQHRTEGALEVGMGVASLGMLAAPLTPVALGVFGALCAARFVVVNKDRIKDGVQNARQVLNEYRRKMADELVNDR